MFNANLIVVGAGGHARSCIDTIEQEGKYVIGGLVGLVEEVGSKQFDYEVLTADSGLAQLAKRFRYALIAVGQIHSPELRIRLYNQYLAAGFIFPTIISSSAYVSPHSTVGAGTIVMNGAVINAGAVVGRNCIINSSFLLWRLLSILYKKCNSIGIKARGISYWPIINGHYDFVAIIYN